MPIGPDIADVLDELGTTFTIHYIDGSTASDGKLDYEAYPEHSSEFIRQFFYTITLPYNTIVVSGDIITFSGTFFLVTKITPALFEDSIVDYTAVLFRCNISGGVLKRFSDTPGFDSDYKRLPKWTDIYTNIRGLHTEARFGPGLDDFQDIMEVPVDKDLLYMTGYYSIKVGDRWWLSATEYYKVEQVSVRRLDNVNIIKLAVDTRS